MNSKFLNLLLVLACAAFIGLGPMRAQSPPSSSDGNGSAVTAPAQHPDTSAAPSAANGNDTRRTDATLDGPSSAETAIANDRGTIPANQPTKRRVNATWISVFGLLIVLGLFGFLRRNRRERTKAVKPAPRDYRRAA